MEIHIPTLVLVLSIASLIHSIAMLMQYLINEKYKGPGWWTLACLFGVIGFGFNYLRVIPELNLVSVIGNTIFYFLGYIFLYIGLERFFGGKENLVIIYTTFAVSFLISIYYSIIEYNTAIRQINISLFFSVYSILALSVLFSNYKKQLSKSIVFLIMVYSINGCFFLIRAIIYLTGPAYDNSMLASPIQEATFLLTLFTSTLWYFGIVLMLNQRLSYEQSEANENLEKMFNTSPDAVLITSVADGIILTYNEALLEMTGYSGEELKNKSIIDLHIWGEVHDRAEFVSELLSKGEIVNRESSFITKSGKKITGLLSAKIIYLDKKPHIYSVTRDITNRKIQELEIRKAKEVAEESRNKFEAIANYSASWESWYDINGKLLWMNNYVEELTGYTVNEYYNSNSIWEMISKQEYTYKLADCFTRVLNGEKLEPLEIEILRKDGSRFWGTISWRVIYNEVGKCVGVRTSCQNITDRKKIEEEVKAKNIELEQVIVEKIKFFSIIAHDLKSPFVGFLGLTELLAANANKNTSELISIANEMNKSANNLFKLLKNLLDWAQMKNGTMIYDEEDIYIGKIIEDVIESLVPRIEAKDIYLKYKPDDDIKVLGDRKMMNSVFMNLIANAVKFTNKGGGVDVVAKEVSEYYEIEIKDTGIGISENEISRLFKVGERIGKTGTDGEPSTGLGLLLCKEFVEKMGGEILVKSELGKGSSFIVRLRKAFYK